MNNNPERSAATMRDMRLPAAALMAAGAAAAIATATAVAYAARPPAPAALRAAPPARAAAAALQQQPTSDPPPTATVARPPRPALFPLALAVARTDNLPSVPTARPTPTAGPATPTDAPPAPTATRTPRIGPPGSHGAPLTYLPALDAAPPAAGCAPRVDVQNVGDEASVAVMVKWYEASTCDAPAGPLNAACSGLIKPGATWTFTGAQLAEGVRSGYVVSLNNRTGSEIGVDLGIDFTVADYLCEQVFIGVSGDAADEARFRTAYLHGGEFAGIPLDRAYGSPIAVTVERRCPAGDPAAPSTTDSAVYTAPSAFDVDVTSPREGMVGADGADGAADMTPYRYAVPAVIADGRRTTIVHVQNADVVCNEADVTLVDASGTATVCAHLSLPPGESRDVDLAACAPANPVDDVGRARSAATVAGTGPLAIAVDIAGIAPGWPVLASYAAPNPAAPPAIGVGVGTTLLAALPIGRPADGQFGTEVVVQNVAADRTAHVTVRFLDRAGDPSADGDASADVPALAAAVFAVPHGSGPEPATARIDCVPNTDDPAAPAAARLVAVVLQGRAAEGAFAPDAPQDWFAADVVPAILDPHEGVVADAVRTTRLALPAIVRAKGPTNDVAGRASRIAIQNRVDRPGFTQMGVFFYDGNGLVDYICEGLSEKQVEYINLSTWGYLNAGFQGSALISAWFWDHSIYDDKGEFVSNLVDLGAAYGDAGPDDADGRTWTSAAPVANDAPLASDGRVPLCPGWAGPDLRPAP